MPLCSSRRSGGFTLLEILLVLLLLSLTAVAVIATIPSNQNDEAQKEARRLYHRLQLLNDEALLSGQDYGMYVDVTHGQYQFLLLTQDGWQAIDRYKMPSENTLPESLAMALTLGSAGEDDASLFENIEPLFGDEDLFDDIDETFSTQESAQKKVEPQLYFLSSGEVTPFSISVYPSDQASHQGWSVGAKANGELYLSRAEDDGQDAY
ncbi:MULTISPECIES: type II secretion system minor pseudopilin GspH [unclassified Vibrio]|uniref:Type II secretion system protein H n=1 Tax=Vibrio sp. HB236076 TaxID=3232307 RepID=A0AB39HB00_9VIBR|nr:type II secretion system minor pseudopilin GspH [Vibrio sp. HB161653]MDP5255218.1 type II secretion system minor pseudopilin GspH [Vibrio sp. HB161653]